MLLVLSSIGLIFNYLEALNNNLQWGFTLRNFDLDTLYGIGTIFMISIFILLVFSIFFKIQNKIAKSLILGSLVGFYKAFNLYALSTGFLWQLSLFTANHTITITLGVLIIASVIGILFQGNKQLKKYHK